MSHDMPNLIETFVARLRANEYLSNAWIIYIGERNTGHESGHHSDILKGLVKTYSLKEYAERNPGIWTTPERKKSYGVSLRNALFDTNFLFLHRFVTVTGDSPEDRELHRKKVLRELYGSLERSRYTTRGTFDMQITGWTAKKDDDGKYDASLNDDMAVALGLCIYWANMFMEKTLPFKTVDYSIFEM